MTQPAPLPPPAPPTPPPGPLAALAPPPDGAVRMLWLGIVVMIASFLVKQILVDLSLGSTGHLLETSRLQAEQAVELSEVDATLDDIDAEIEALEADAPKPPSEPSQFDAFTEKQKQHEEKLDKLKKKRSEKDEELEP